MKLWDKLKEEYNNELANKVLEPITITFPDGKTTSAKAWQSTPYEVAKGIRYGKIKFINIPLYYVLYKIKYVCTVKDLLIIQLLLK